MMSKPTKFDWPVTDLLDLEASKHVASRQSCKGRKRRTDKNLHVNYLNVAPPVGRCGSFH